MTTTGRLESQNVPVIRSEHVAEVIFIDESIITDLEHRTRVKTDVIPRSNDWVVIPGDEHSHLEYHVIQVCFDFTVTPPQVRVSFRRESRARN